MASVARSCGKATASREFFRIGASYCSRRAATSVRSSPRLPSNTAELAPHYEITLGGSARVAERAVQVLEIKPRDEFRYGYMLWLDQETAMPLQSTAHRRAGRGRRADSVHGYRDPCRHSRGRARSPRSTPRASRRCARPKSAPLAAEIPWRAAAVPGGFRLSVATQSPIAGSDTPVEHLVYSDGLATVSVFIEDPATKAEVRRRVLHCRQHERVLA